ncbi:hypothetical protein [Paracoccus sp. ME4]|uniref:hypothetical protein n=1 Tax=Paracoccus sp. ME4 TaxID=3138066 RepID=UPI00398A722F
MIETHRTEQSIAAPAHAGRNGNLPAKDRSLLAAGDMIIYPFLWHWQHQSGLQRAEKMRPCVVLMRINESDPTAIILPITTKAPSLRHDRLFVPAEECAAIGMPHHLQASIGLNDFNFDTISTSTCIRKRVPMRSFSPQYMEHVMSEFRRVYDAKRAHSVTRIPDPDLEYSM